MTKKVSLKRWLLKKVNVKIFCFGNTHLSNIASHNFLDKNISELKLKELIYTIKRNHGVNYFLIPDHFLVSVGTDNKKISRRFKIITIDPDMRLNISEDWKSFEDYKNNISSKYKKRLRRVFHLSNPLEVKPIKKEDIPTQLSQMEELYLNVYKNSSFSGPPFKMNIFLEFFKNKEINHQIFGYFLKDKLVAFSSEFFNQNKLYSYYIGLDYNVNRKYKIYNRILYDTISNGITKKATQIIFGRTASEFKSTVGAIPEKSKSAIFIVNPIINFLLSPILKRISPDVWIQREPFK
jgi:predicted N-acyltransferase